MILGIDLAARFSAAVAVDASGQAVYQFDSWGIDSDQFAQVTAAFCAVHNPSVIAIEDLPYGLSRQAQIKAPLRAQGMMISHLRLAKVLDRAFFIAPASWQRGFEGVWKGKAPGATEAAVSLGFVAPDLLGEYADDVPPLGKEHAKERAKIRGQLKKASTDYNDAFLIAEWVRRGVEAGDFPRLQGVQPVNL